MSTIKRFNLDHLVILASSLKNSLPFYETLLPLIGFTKQRPHVFTNPQEIALDIQQAQTPEHRYQRYAPGLNHMGFKAHSVDEIMAVRDAMQQQGYNMPETQQLSGAIALFIKDPDGMRIELTHYPDE